MLNPDSPSDVTYPTPKDLTAESINQEKLSRKGLEFIFDLYKNAGYLNRRVSENSITI